MSRVVIKMEIVVTSDEPFNEAAVTGTVTNIVRETPGERLADTIADELRELLADDSLAVECQI